MPDTRPYPPDLIDGDRAVVDGTVADPGDDATARARISQTIGPWAEGTTGGDKQPSVTWRLTILVIVTLLPVLAFAAFMIVYNARDQRTQYENQLQDTTRATMLAVDTALSNRITILATLGHTGELRARDWRAFYNLAVRAIAEQPDARIALYDLAGHIIFSTYAPFGTDLDVSGSPEAIRNVVATKQPYITDLYVGSVSKVPVVAVYVPVIENGVVVNILSLAMPPDFVSRILRSQFRAIGGVGAVFDRETKLIGRTRSEGQFIGRKAVAGYREALQKSDEGSMEVRNLEGLLVRSVYTKSALSGWSTTLAVENAALDAPLLRSLWLFGGGGLLIFVAALLVASYYGRKFVAPVATLIEMAQSLGRGDPLPRKRLGLREMQVIGDQMVLAAEVLKHHADEREKLFASLETRTFELVKSNEQLEVANRELEGLSYSTSHVLRAPLRAIDGFSHILLEEHSTELDSEGRRLVGMLRSSAHELNEQIDGILEFLRLGRDIMHKAKIEMVEVVQIAVGGLEPYTRGRNLVVEVSPLPSAFGDAAMIRRIWSCLLDNAVKFTSPKRDAKIEVGATADKGEMIYYVRDNGVGFDMQFVGKLFGVFDRLHGADFPGNGTGLAIVQRIVSRHGGRVWAEGKVGEGATFYFTLPGSETVHDRRV